MRGSLAQKCILRAGLPRGLPLPPGEVKAPSVCGLGCPCHPDPWTSTSSARPSRGCCRVWMAPGGIGCTLAPAPTWPCWAGTTSAVSVGLVGGRGVPLHPSTRAPPLPSFLAPPHTQDCVGEHHCPRVPPQSLWGSSLSRHCPPSRGPAHTAPSLPSLASAAAYQPLCALPCGTRPDTSPLWLQWLPQPQPQLRVRPRRRRRPQPRRPLAPPIFRAARISLHRWGGCGPRCCLRAEALVALGQVHSAHWAPQQDWHWARRYGLPFVVRVDLSRVVPPPPGVPSHTGPPGPVPIPKQALAFAPFSPPKRLRLVVSHGSIDLDVNGEGP